MKDYDVIIVGSGLGGLSAATALSRADKKVLLLEKHNVAGGYATSFMRGRFEFDASLHQLSGVGTEDNRGPLWALLNEYGVASKVEFVPIPNFYRCVFPGLDLTLPVGRANFEDLMCKEFPADAEGIKRFSSVMFDFAREAIAALFLGKGPGELDPSEFPTISKYGGRTVAEVLYPEVSDEKARAVLTQLCAYLGQTPSKGSFAPYAMAATTYINHGPVHIKGKSQALSQAFVDTIEEHGGEVWLNNGAVRIVTLGGKVTGVIAEDGTEIVCPYVVCNVNPVVTCVDLIGTENVPDWYLKRLGVWSPGIGTFNVFLGLDLPYTDFGLTSHETFVGLGYFDWDKADEQAKRDVDFDPPGVGVTTYGLADESFSPPGTTALVITFSGYGNPWQRLTSSEYLEAKDRIAEKAVAYAERLVPTLRDHIEVMEVATPLTNIRYSGNPGGSFSGFAESRQPQGWERIPARGPLEGLYFANAWVSMGGGYFPTILGGRFAANDVLQDMAAGGIAPTVVKELQNRMEAQIMNSVRIRDVSSFLTKGLAPKMYTSRIPLRVQDVVEETLTTKTLRMAPVQGDLPYFRAGQYINLFVEVDGVLTSRPYSISSPPGDPWYDITVRRKEGGFVSPYLVDRVKPGDTFESTVPGGGFHYNPVTDSSDLVFLAGGTGITPFASIVRDVTKKKLSLKIHFIYGSRDPEDIIFEDELREIAARHQNIRVDFVISEPPERWTGLSGFLDEKLISSLVGSAEGKTFFICGPARMQVLCTESLAGLGVTGRRIKREACGPLDDVTEEKGWPGITPESQFQVVEEKSGRTLSVKAGEPLIIGLERAGLVVPAACRSGECTACRTRLVSGKVFVPNGVHVRQSDEKANYIHACMSYPLEDLRIVL